MVNSTLSTIRPRTTPHEPREPSNVTMRQFAHCRSPRPPSPRPRSISRSCSPAPRIGILRPNTQRQERFVAPLCRRTRSASRSLSTARNEDKKRAMALKQIEVTEAKERHLAREEQERAAARSPSPVSREPANPRHQCRSASRSLPPARNNVKMRARALMQIEATEAARSRRERNLAWEKQESAQARPPSLVPRPTADPRHLSPRRAPSVASSSQLRTSGSDGSIWGNSRSPDQWSAADWAQWHEVHPWKGRARKWIYPTGEQTRADRLMSSLKTTDE